MQRSAHKLLLANTEEPGRGRDRNRRTPSAVSRPSRDTLDLHVRFGYVSARHTCRPFYNQVLSANGSREENLDVCARAGDASDVDGTRRLRKVDLFHDEVVGEPKLQFLIRRGLCRVHVEKAHEDVRADLSLAGCNRCNPQPIDGPRDIRPFFRDHETMSRHAGSSADVAPDISSAESTRRARRKTSHSPRQFHDCSRRPDNR